MTLRGTSNFRTVRGRSAARTGGTHPLYYCACRRELSPSAPARSADYNHGSGSDDRLFPCRNLSMPILWLRVALCFYAVGLLYALLALTRTSALLNRVALPAMSLGMVFQFVSLSRVGTPFGTINARLGTQLRVSPGADDHGRVHDRVSGLPDHVARHRCVSAGFRSDLCRRHHPATISAPVAGDAHGAGSSPTLP